MRGALLMQPLAARLRSSRPIIADGAMGTMLMARGLAAGACPESVNLDRPEVLEEIATSYLAAGAEVVQTNTFGGSPLKLEPYGLELRTEDVNARAVAAARRAVADRAYVAASCGPSGRVLQPYGDAAPDVILASFRRQLQVVVSEGVDLICIETMTDLAEAILAVQAARSVSSSILISATMTFDLTPKGFYTVMGNSIAQAIEGLASAGADLVGSNCGNGARNMTLVAEQFVRHTDLPVVIRPNAGLPELRGGLPVYPESPAFMAQEGRAMLALGVKVLGGCCGTTPGHISALRAIVEETAPAP